LAGLLVEGEHRRLLAAGRADQLVAVHQRRLRVVPAAGAPLEVLAEVLAPDLLTRGRLDAHQVAELPEGVDQVPVYRRRAARARVIAARLADLGLPEQRAVLLVDTEDVGGVLQVAHGEEAAAGDGHAGEADAQPLALPHFLHALLGPLLLEALVGRQV